MTLENIRQLLRGSAPFKLRMVSGRQIDVPHPDFVALSPEGTSIVFINQESAIEVIRINQIESFETPGSEKIA